MMSRMLAVLCLAGGVFAAVDASAQSGGSDKPSWTDRVSVYGDFRGRAESFFYDDSERPNRHRPRYRLRFGIKAKLNDNVSFNGRLASGSPINSGNQTLGSGDDFDMDDIFIDKAEIIVHPLADAETRGDLALRFGKVSNPFKGKSQGKDLLVWDSDITPEGFAVTWSPETAESWDFDADLGYFVISEEKSAKNVYVFGAQVDNVVEASETVDVQVKGSVYHFDNLNSDFLARARDADDFGGNTPGLTEGFAPINFVEARASVSSSSNEKWPVKAWGQFMVNTSATAIVDPTDDSVTYEAQDTGYSAAVFVGDVVDEDIATIQESSPSKRTRFQGDIKIKS